MRTLSFQAGVHEARIRLGERQRREQGRVPSSKRNELVPVPEFESLPEKSRELLATCDRNMEREYYEEAGGRLISELFLEDKAVLLPLPVVPFNSSLFEAGIEVEIDR